MKPVAARKPTGARSTTVAVGAFAALMMFARAAAQEVPAIEPNLKSIVHELERARDVQEIQNLMTRRMYFHSVGQNENELALWSRSNDVRWAQNQGCFIGMKSIAAGYDVINLSLIHI